MMNRFISRRSLQWVVALMFIFVCFPHVQNVAAGTGNSKVYFPIVARAPVETVFGAFLDANPDGGLALMKNAGSTWTHYPLHWSTVEPQVGQRNWAAVAELETELFLEANDHLQPVIYINDTPGWALKAGYTCGAVAQNQFGAMAAFLTDLVKRYSVPPYNVRYYELWNEPEAIGTLGCWGDRTDLAYDGGRYYGEMLKVAYPAIKAANPEAQVIFGGMVLDCNPDVAGLCSDVWKKSMGHFLEGALVSGGGPYFDGISFHAYDYYQGALGQYANPNWASAWNTTGPVALVKAAFLRNVLQKFNLTGKYLMNTEIGMVCGSTGQEPACTTADHMTTLSGYIAQAYAGAKANGFRNMIWFSVAGWRGTGLIDSSSVPVQSYYAFKTARSILGEATFAREIKDYPGIKGFEFTFGGLRIWALWSVSGSVIPLTFTSQPFAVFKMDGTSLQPANPLNVGLEALFVEFRL